MQFITRVLIVLGVLAGLGYGSYAFGKYVLSARLFGPTKNSATAKGTLQSPSDVDVEVVPAPQSKANSDDSSGVAPTSEAQPTPAERSESTPSTDNGDDNRGSSVGSDNNDNDNDTPRERPRRHKRRRRSTERPKKRETTAQTSTQPAVQAPPAREQNVEPSANDNSGSSNDAPRIPVPRNDAPRVETPRNDNPVPSPTRRERERRTVPKIEPRTDVAPPRRRESSPVPVPVPEGALGGRSESPVPVPG